MSAPHNLFLYIWLHPQWGLHEHTVVYRTGTFVEIYLGLNEQSTQLVNNFYFIFVFLSLVMLFTIKMF